MTSHVIEWFAGIDWGSERHQVCVLNSRGEIVAERDFPHTGTGLAELGAWLANIAGEARNMAVAIEVPHGPVVDLLLDRSFVVYAINPKQLDRLRDRFSIAGSKDDRRDARVAASGLRTDRHLFRVVQPSDPAIIELREWSRLAEELQQDRVRLCNRIRQQLWRYYPQLLELVDDMAADWLLELWTMARTPERAKRLRAATVARLLARHRIRRFDVAAVISILRKPAIQVAAGVTEAAVLRVRSLIARLRLVNQELRAAEKKLDELLQARIDDADCKQDRELSDAAILTLTARRRQGHPRHSSCRSVRRAQSPGLCCLESTLGGRACDKAQREVSCRVDALCRSPPAAQCRVLLDSVGSSERSRYP